MKGHSFPGVSAAVNIMSSELRDSCLFFNSSSVSALCFCCILIICPLKPLSSFLSLCSSQRVRGGRVSLPKWLLHSQPVALWRRQRLRGQQWWTVRWVHTPTHLHTHVNTDMQAHIHSHCLFIWLVSFSLFFSPCQTCVNVPTRSSAAQMAVVSLNIGTVTETPTVRTDRTRKTAVSFSVCVCLRKTRWWTCFSS